MKLHRLTVGLCLLAACSAPVHESRPDSSAAAPAAPSAPSAPAAPVPPSSIYTFEGVEVFGSRKVSKAELLEVIGMPAPGTRIDTSQGDFPGCATRCCARSARRRRAEEGHRTAGTGAGGALVPAEHRSQQGRLGAGAALGLGSPER